MRRMRRSGEPARRDRTRLSQGGVLAPGGPRCLGGGCVHGYTPGPGPPAVTARVAACGLLRHPVSLHLGVPDAKLLSPAGALPSPPRVGRCGRSPRPRLSFSRGSVSWARASELPPRGRSQCPALLRPLAASLLPCGRDPPLTPRLAHAAAWPAPNRLWAQQDHWLQPPQITETLPSRRGQPPGTGRRADLFSEGTFLTPQPVPAGTQPFSTRGDGDPSPGTLGQAWRRVQRSQAAWGLVLLEARVLPNTPQHAWPRPAAVRRRSRGHGGLCGP